MSRADDAPADLGPDPRVELWTRVGCHLCDPARETVATVCDELGVGWRERDVDTDPTLDPSTRSSYSDEVPVTLVDGSRHDFWRVDPDRLRAALTASRNG